MGVGQCSVVGSVLFFVLVFSLDIFENEEKYRLSQGLSFKFDMFQVCQQSRHMG